MNVSRLVEWLSLRREKSYREQEKYFCADDEWNEAYWLGYEKALSTVDAFVKSENENDKINVKVKRVRDGAKLPTYGSDGAGCFDFYAPDDRFLLAGETEKIPLGVAMEVPEGHVLLIMPRSSIGLKTPLRMANSVGVIDSDYRGEISALYENQRELVDFHIAAGDRIAQGCIVPVPTVEFEEVNTLSETKRGTGGFGSTGK